MAIKFFSDLAPSDAPAVSCLCAQLAPRMEEILAIELVERPLPLDVVEHLREHAVPQCVHCKGTGVHQGPPSHASYIEVPTVVLAVLGLEDAHGEVGLPAARRALMRARNRRLAPFTHEGSTTYGPPCACEDGTIELRPVRIFDAGIDEGRIRDTVEAVHAFVERAADAGATLLRWG